MDGTRVTERPNDGSTSESPRTPEFFLWDHSGSPNRFDPKVAGGRSGSEHPEPKAWPQRQWWEFLGSYTRCSGLAFTELGGRERCAHHLKKFYRSPLAVATRLRRAISIYSPWKRTLKYSPAPSTSSRKAPLSRPLTYSYCRVPQSTTPAPSPLQGMTQL